MFRSSSRVKISSFKLTKEMSIFRDFDINFATSKIIFCFFDPIQFLYVITLFRVQFGINKH